MPNEAVTIYVTKDALNVGGIRVVRASVIAGGQAVELTPRGSMRMDKPLLEPWDWRSTLAQAAMAVEVMQEEAVSFHESKIAAIRAIDLTKPVEG